MTARISINDEAPNFDLSSTEGALLMLQDEVPRTAVLLYVFIDPSSDRVRRDLASLADARRALAESEVKIMAISPAKLDVLKELQAELGLPFPLLCDDRSFTAEYGVEAADEGAESPSALYLINRRRLVVWMANPVASVDGALQEVEAGLKRESSPTANYPRSVINRLVDRWVN